MWVTTDETARIDDYYHLILTAEFRLMIIESTESPNYGYITVTRWEFTVEQSLVGQTLENMPELSWNKTLEVLAQLPNATSAFTLLWKAIRFRLEPPDDLDVDHPGANTRRAPAF